jgi:hypothetical protein
LGVVGVSIAEPHTEYIRIDGENNIGQVERPCTGYAVAERLGSIPLE